MEKEHKAANSSELENSHEDKNESGDSIFIPIADKPQSRRVSFASSNFIKKFSIDPDRNTIWDATYEEVINSDSTHSSENAGGTLSVQHTYVHNQVQSETCKENKTDGSIIFDNEGGEDMDCDTSLPECLIMDKENINIMNIDKTQKVKYSSNEFCELINMTAVDNINMDFTQCISSVNSLSVHNTIHVNTTYNMDCTKFIINQNACRNKEKNNSVLLNNSVEYTCQIPNLNVENMDLDCNMETNSMELTAGAGAPILEANDGSPISMEQTLNNSFKPNIKNVSVGPLVENDKNEESRMADSTPIPIHNSTEFSAAVKNEIVSPNVIKTTTNVRIPKVLITAPPTKKIEKLNVTSATSCDETKATIENRSRNESQQCVAKNKFIVKENGDRYINPKHVIFENLETPDFEKSNSSNKVLHVLQSSSKIDEEDVNLHTPNRNDRTCTQSILLSNEKSESLKNKVANPKMSFSVNCMLSPCSDDTQHLINYNLNNQPSKSDFSKIIAGDLNPSFINSKVMALSDFSCDTLPMSLNNTRDCKDDNKSLCIQTTYIVNTESTKKPIQNKRLSSEGTDFHMDSEANCKKLLLDHETNDDLYKDKTLNISQENLTLSESIEASLTAISEAAQAVIHDITNSGITNTSCNKTKDETKKFKPIMDAYLDTCINMKTKLIEHKNKIENFKYFTTEAKILCNEEINVISSFFKECNVEELSLRRTCNSDAVSEVTEISKEEDSFSLQINDDSTHNPPKILDFEEQIRNKCKRSKNYWTIIAVTENTCKIYTLFRTLRIEVKFNKISGIVSQTDVYNNISDSSEPTALLVHKILKDRLNEKNIRSGVGEKYEILTLLDYVYINMQKIVDIFDEFNNFTKRYNFEMDRNFVGTFQIINLQLRSSWTFFVDMAELESISEKSIRVTSDGGAIYEKEITKLKNRSSCGLPYLKKFLKDVKDYINLCGAQKCI